MEKVLVPVEFKTWDVLRVNIQLLLGHPSTIFSSLLILVLLMGARPLQIDHIIPGLLTTFAAFLVLLTLIAWFHSRRTISDIAENHGKIVYVFSATQFETLSDSAQTTHQWRAVLKAVETKSGFNLFFERNLPCPIPKRCVQSATDLTHIREILRNNLGEKAEVRSSN